MRSVSACRVWFCAAYWPPFEFNQPAIGVRVGECMYDKGSRGFWQIRLVLSFAAVVVFANLHAMQPLLPELKKQFALSELQTSWSYAIGTLSLGISLLVYGALADAWGRKPVLAVSFVGMLLSTTMLTQADSFTSLLTLRAIQGFCLGGLPAVAIAYFGEELTPSAMFSAVGFYISASSLGGISGRVLAGWCAESGHWVWVFYPLSVLSLLLVVAFWRLLPKVEHFHARPLSWRRAGKENMAHLRHPGLLLTYLLGGINFAIYLNQYTYISFVLSEAPFSLSSFWIGLLFLTYLTGTVGSALSARIAQRFGPLDAMQAGVYLMIAGSLCTLVPHLVSIVSGFFISAFGFFLTHSLATSLVNRQAETAKASASALYLVFYYVGASIGGLWLHPFYRAMGWSGVVVASVLGYTLALWLCLLLKRRFATNAPRQA